MKILLTSPLPPPSGGIATWTVRYKQYCESNDVPLVIVNNALCGSRKAQINAKRNLLDEVKRTVRVVFNLCCRIHDEKPEVFHLNSSCSRFGIYRDCLCAVIANARSIPVVLQCHCNIQDQVRSRLAEFALKMMISKSRKVLVLNRFSAEYARRFAPNKVIVIPNFTEGKLGLERKTTADTVKHVIFVGHVCRDKGVVEIFQVAKEFPHIRFSLVGPIHEEFEKVELSKNVFLLGERTHEDVMNLLLQADMFLFPSHSEGFANALLEAMSTGLPVVATDVGANAEMIEENGGIIVPVGNSMAIKRALACLERDIVRRTQMSKWNKQKVQEYYLQETVMRKLMTIYEAVSRERWDES